MNAEVLQLISIISYILAVILFLVAVLLFFVLDIRSVIDDLSGRKEERQIRELREQNTQTELNRNGQILYDMPAVKNRMTADLERTHKLFQNSEDKDTALLQADEEATELLKENRSMTEEETTLLRASEETSLLSPTEETTLLTNQKTELANHYYVLLDELIIHTKERI